MCEKCLPHDLNACLSLLRLCSWRLWTRQRQHKAARLRAALAVYHHRLLAAALEHWLWLHRSKVGVQPGSAPHPPNGVHAWHVSAISRMSAPYVAHSQ